VNFAFLKDRQVRVLIVVLSLFAIIISIVGFSFLNYQEATFREAELDNLQLIGQRNAAMLGNWVKERKTDTQLLASNPELARELSLYLQSKHTRLDSVHIEDRLNAYNTQKGYNNAFITNLKGRILLSLSLSNKYINAEITNDWQAALLAKTSTIGEIKQSELVAGDVVLDFFVPIYRDTQNKTDALGFIVLRSDVNDYINVILADLPMKSKTVESILVEKVGDKVVYLSKLRNLPQAPFRYSLPLSTPNLPAAIAVNSTDQSFSGIAYSGQKVIAALDSINYTKWHLITQIDYKEALRSFYGVRNIVILVMLILFAFLATVLINRAGKQKQEIQELKDDNTTQRKVVLKHFEYLFKYANDIILLTDMDGKIQEANGKADNMYGYSYNELKDMDIYQLTAPEYHERIKGIISDPNITTGMMYEAEHVKKSGARFPVEVSTISIDIDGGQHLQKIIRDITERKESELQLIKLNKELADRVVQRTNEVVDVSSKLDGFFKVSIDLLCIFNKDSYFVKINPSWGTVLGYTEEELLSQKITDFIHPDDVESAENTIRELFKDVVITHYITRFRSKDGSYKYLEWNASAAGDLIYAAVHDITESKKAEDEILALNSVLMNTNKELESFSYSVSHDLRAPLRSMEGYSSALHYGYADKIDEQGMHYLDRIQNAAVKMSTLINDLLELSQLGQKQLSFALINLSDIVNKIAVELKEANPNQQISFRVTETASVMADSDLMKIVLKNLLDNARKFSSKKDISEIVFGTRKDGEHTVYFVQDNGEGFDMEYADKLFTPFQRYHHASDFPGTGIGLSIVFRIITRHKGKVWVESAVDKGTTVNFTLNNKGD